MNLVWFLWAMRAFAALPPEAIAVLESIPGKRLSLDAVMRQAVQVSDGYRALFAAENLASSFRNQAKAITDPRLYGKGLFGEDRSDRASTTSPLSSKLSKYSLGVESRFLTGTSISLEASHGTSLVRNSLFPDIDNADSKISIGLVQPILKNAFGESFRATSDAQLALSRAKEIGLSRSKEEWATGIASLFYGSWLSQQKLIAAIQSVARRERLLKSVEIRAKRGTSERQDLLQVKSALMKSKVALDQARQDLGDRWRLLVTILKLPESFLAIDPAEIPIHAEPNIEGALRRCGTPESITAGPAKTSESEELEASREATTHLVRAAESDHRPDLDLGIGYAVNDVDAEASGTLSELLTLSHPSLTVSLTLSIPLGGYGPRAKVESATSDFIRSDSAFGQARDLVRTQWKNRCLDLFRLTTGRKMLEETLVMQTEREKLEETRFGNGRTGTFQVITAGDDLAETVVQLRAAQAQLYTSVMEVDKISGDLKGYISTIEESIKR